MIQFWYRSLHSSSLQVACLLCHLVNNVIILSGGTGGILWEVKRASIEFFKVIALGIDGTVFSFWLKTPSFWTIQSLISSYEFLDPFISPVLYWHKDIFLHASSAVHNETSSGLHIVLWDLASFYTMLFVWSSAQEAAMAPAEAWFVFLSSSSWATCAEVMSVAVRTHSCPLLRSSLPQGFLPFPFPPERQHHTG